MTQMNMINTDDQSIRPRIIFNHNYQRYQRSINYDNGTQMNTINTDDQSILPESYLIIIISVISVL